MDHGSWCGCGHEVPTPRPMAHAHAPQGTAPHLLPMHSQSPPHPRGGQHGARPWAPPPAHTSNPCPCPARAPAERHQAHQRAAQGREGQHGAQLQRHGRGGDGLVPGQATGVAQAAVLTVLLPRRHPGARLAPCLGGTWLSSQGGSVSRGWPGLCEQGARSPAATRPAVPLHSCCLS